MRHKDVLKESEKENVYKGYLTIYDIYKMDQKTWNKKDQAERDLRQNIFFFLARP